MVRGLSCHGQKPSKLWRMGSLRSWSECTTDTMERRVVHITITEPAVTSETFSDSSLKAF